MNFEEMTIKQLKEYLEQKGIDYSTAELKADYIALASEVKEEAEDTEETNDLVKAFDEALVIERTEVKSEPSQVDRFAGRDYSQLTVGERKIIRSLSPEYTDAQDGVPVKVTERLSQAHYIAKKADRGYTKLVKGKVYNLTNADYEALKNKMVRVKTVATQDKCCGQAVWEDVKLLEVVNG